MNLPRNPCFSFIAVCLFYAASYSASSLSPLHVGGKTIKNAGDSTVILRAINLDDDMEATYDSNSRSFSTITSWLHTANDFMRIKAMGFNAVRANICPAHVDSMNMQRLKDLVGWAQDAGLYIIIAYFAPPGSTPYNGYYSEKNFWNSVTNQNVFLRQWGKIMAYCSPYPHVMYEFLNEPQIAYSDADTAQGYSSYSYRDAYKNLCKDLIDTNKVYGDKVVVIDGLGSAATDYRGFNYLNSQLSSYKNIVYSFHYYMKDFAFRKCNWNVDNGLYKSATGSTRLSESCHRFQTHSRFRSSSANSASRFPKKSPKHSNIFARS